jgi:hypothetical protein
MSEENGLSVKEAGELIEASMMQPEEAEPEVSAEPEAEIIPNKPEPPSAVVQRATESQAQLAQYEHALAAEAQAINAAELDARQLRKDNPAEYAARTMELLSRKQNLQQATANYQRVAEGINAQVAQHERQQHEKAMAAERDILKREIGWDDKKKVRLENYLKGKGYTEQDFAQVRDAKTVMLAWRSMEAEDKAKQQPKVRKKLPQKKVSQVEEEILRNNIPPDSVRAAAARIEHMRRGTG